MLKKTIPFTDFNGQEGEDEFYFNLGKAELMELEVGGKGGSFAQALKNIIAAKNNAALISEFKRLILMSYGQKSEDGRRFIKSDELREEFSQTAAFDVLFMELSTSDGAAVDFVKGILPSDMTEEVTKAMAETTSNVPKPPQAPS